MNPFLNLINLRPVDSGFLFYIIICVYTQSIDLARFKFIILLINKKAALKIGSATGTMAIISVAAGICGAICMSKRNKKKKQEHILEIRETTPRITYPIEEF